MIKDFYKVVEKRRTVRNFCDKPIEKEKLERILKAGVKAPTNNHMRQWHFIFIKDKTKRKEILERGEAFSRTPDKNFLNETLNKITDPFQRAIYSYSVPLQEKIILSAPELRVVCFKMQKPLIECETLFDLNCMASVWLVIENILLSMAAEGLFGVTIVPFKTVSIKNILGIPNDYEVATFLPIGYPAKEPKLKQVEVKLEERIHINVW